MKKFLILTVMICVLNSQFVLANGQEQTISYHLDKYPEIGDMFDWGMSIENIKEVLNQRLFNVGKNKYQAKFTSGGLELNTTFIISDDGLESLVLQFDMSPDKFYSLLDKLRVIYGEPSAVDTKKAVMQWKDSLNDVVILIAGEKKELYSVVVGLRSLRNKSVPEGLEPGKVSSLEGIRLGMSKEDFLNQNKYFDTKKLPHEEGMPEDTEIYQASLTLNLSPSEAFFEFNQNKLTDITIPLSLESQAEDDMSKVFNDHLGFLFDLYGRPSDETASMATWNDGVSEVRFGLHPSGKMFVVSWDTLN